MDANWLQFVASGLTAGAIYALVALGFSIVYNASGAINFTQGEFVMIGGMSAVTLLGTGLPLAVAVPLAVVAAVVVGLLLEKLAIEPARHADTVTLIIITIGASLFLRGLAQLVWDKRIHALPAFSGDAPIGVLGATIVPQSLWVIGGTALAVAALLGALGGVLTAPITFTSYDTGVMLGLKGFAAAMLGGLGSFVGAVTGGLVLGLVEALGAGFVSSAYKDAIAFVIILAVLFFLPGGLVGARRVERV